MSETKTKDIYQVMLECQKKIMAIKKDAVNPHFKNTYATLSQILSEVKPVLNEFGLLLTQPIIDGKVITTIHYGSSHVASEIKLPENISPQQVGSAITYYRRYTLASLLSLEMEDDDGNGSNPPIPNNNTEKKDERPWLSDKQFTSALNRIKAGEKNLFDQINSEFRMKKEYREQLKNA